MCDTQNNNASSSSTEERRRITNRIDTRISSLITPIDENEHINSFVNTTNDLNFADILKRKLDDSTLNESSSPSTSKIPKLATTRYYPINIATLNVRGLNDSVKQLQILDYFDLHHLDIIGLSELHVTDTSFTKIRRFKTRLTHDFFWAINDDKTDPASGCVLALTKELSRQIGRA